METRKTIAIGVDIGGSHVSCAASDLVEKKYLPETFAENKLDNRGTADEIMDIWARTIKETILKLDSDTVVGIGFAMPGPFDYANGIALFDKDVQKYENLFGINISEAIRKKLNLPEEFPVRFVNDATAFALAEDWLGKSAGTTCSLAITLGTGFGSAFLDNHLPVVSGNDVPEKGYVYHLPFESGNADDYFSTRGLLTRYLNKTGKMLSGVKKLSELASENPIAQNLFVDFGHQLGVFLKPLIEKFGAEVLVIGGNISNAFPLFGPHLQDYFTENGVHIPVVVSELKETASMIGSAVLLDDNYYDKIKPILKEI